VGGAAEKKFHGNDLQNCIREDPASRSVRIERQQLLLAPMQTPLLGFQTCKSQLGSQTSLTKDRSSLIRCSKWPPPPKAYTHRARDQIAGGSSDSKIAPARPSVVAQHSQKEHCSGLCAIDDARQQTQEEV